MNNTLEVLIRQQIAAHVSRGLGLGTTSEINNLAQNIASAVAVNQASRMGVSISQLVEAARTRPVLVPNQRQAACQDEDSSEITGL